MSSIHPAADTVGVSKKELAIRYPALRQFGVSVNSYGYNDFDAKFNDNNLAKGKIKTERISSFFNTPAIRWKNNSLSGTVYYTYTSTKLKDITHGADNGQFLPVTSDKSTIDLALNYSRSDMIFNQPIIYSLVARGISDNLNTVRRFNFNGSFTLPLKKNENTSFSVGLLVLVDPSSPLPVEPIINYYHKFASSGLELIVDLPNGANLKKGIGKNAWFSVGSNQTSYTLFYDHRNDFLDGKISYNTIELKSGAAFEYLFAKNVMLNVGGGINSFLASRVFRDGEKYSNASIKSTTKSSPYVHVGVSMLSF
ncbi:hypothetical protein [Chryseobacterium sp.]|uniref:hypothetical protein n=1 Tax=Chryseobacterium sp. TaxID=1871047 RepID=UPI0028529734|nr:hypothetical protein [Chryseobacterium sp.]